MRTLVKIPGAGRANSAGRRPRPQRLVPAQTCRHPPPNPTAARPPSRQPSLRSSTPARTTLFIQGSIPRVLQRPTRPFRRDRAIGNPASRPMSGWPRDERSRCLSAFVSETAAESWVIDSTSPVDRPYEERQVEGFTVHLSPEWAGARRGAEAALPGDPVGQSGAPRPHRSRGSVAEADAGPDLARLRGRALHQRRLPSVAILAGRARGMDQERAKSVQFTRNLATLIDEQPNLVAARAGARLSTISSSPSAIPPSSRRTKGRLDSSLYDSVEHKGGGRERAYALKDQREFLRRAERGLFRPERLLVPSPASNCARLTRRASRSSPRHGIGRERDKFGL